MGKAHSREAEPPLREVYVERPVPEQYVLRSPRGEAGENNSVIAPSVRAPTVVSQRSTASVYSVQTSDVMAASRWKNGEFLERWTKYLGRFQTQAITATALGNLRTVIRQSKLKKTKIKMTPLGISFGSKYTGTMNTDKVAYRFLSMDDVELVQPDAVHRDLLLIVSKVKNDIAIKNGDADVIYTQNHEINAFSMEPRDALRFHDTFNVFKQKDVIIKSPDGSEAIIRSPGAKSPLRKDSVDSRPWTYAVPESRGWVMPAAGQNTQIKTLNVENYRHVRPHSVSNPTMTKRISTSSNAPLSSGQPSASYVYNGSLVNDKHRESKPKQHNASMMVDFPGSIGPGTSTEIQSLTTKVYFEHDGPARADVECQVKPKLHVETSRETSAQQVNESSSRQLELTDQTDRDSVNRRMDDLSREMEKLKSLVGTNDEEIQTRTVTITTADNTSLMNGDDVDYHVNGSLRRDVSTTYDDDKVNATNLINGSLQKAAPPQTVDIYAVPHRSNGVHKHSGGQHVESRSLEVTRSNGSAKKHSGMNGDVGYVKSTQRSTLQTNETRTNGVTKSTKITQGEAHAGTINTRAGTVDVVVDNLNVTTTPRERRHSSQSTNARVIQQNGGSQVKRAVTSDQYATRSLTRQHHATQNGSTLPYGRVTYYRAVTPEPVFVRNTTPAIVRGRSRSIEPLNSGRRVVYYK